VGEKFSQYSSLYLVSGFGESTTGFETERMIEFKKRKESIANFKKEKGRRDEMK
jgi:hypothetical protein